MNDFSMNSDFTLSYCRRTKPTTTKSPNHLINMVLCIMPAFSLCKRDKSLEGSSMICEDISGDHCYHARYYCERHLWRAASATRKCDGEQSASYSQEAPSPNQHHSFQPDQVVYHLNRQFTFCWCCGFKKSLSFHVMTN